MINKCQNNNEQDHSVRCMWCSLKLSKLEYDHDIHYVVAYFTIL